MSCLKLFLSALAIHWTLFPIFAGIAVSPAQKEEFARYGITVVVENYTRSDKGQLLTQKDLDDDLEIILKHFRQIGRQYVQMSRCRTIIIRGSHPKIAFASGSKINFKYKF